MVSNTEEVLEEIKAVRREMGEIGCRMGFIHKRSKQRDGRNG